MIPPGPEVPKRRIGPAYPNRLPRSGPRWFEYMVKTLRDLPDNQDDLHRVLVQEANVLGREGWQLVSGPFNEGRRDFIMWFMREIL